MRRISLLLSLCTFLLAIGGSDFCLGFQQYPAPPQTGPLCAPPQTSRSVQPVARAVQVTVPMPQPPKPYMPPRCVPPSYCPPPAAAAPSRSMPVRVDIAVRPEACDQQRPVPVVYRDPGFLGPMISYSMGLIGATIAAPFRVAEMLVPLAGRSCPPKQPCGPPPRPQDCGYQGPPPFAAKCPPPITQPAALCQSVFGCAPPGPSVAPLPPCAPPPACGPYMPPALVARDEEPPCAPQSLLGGLMQWPVTMLERGRIFGDLGRASSGSGPCAR
jgi:hypothetical protein